MAEQRAGDIQPQRRYFPGHYRRDSVLPPQGEWCACRPRGWATSRGWWGRLSLVGRRPYEKLRAVYVQAGRPWTGVARRALVLFVSAVTLFE